jgi:hypothetical protein
MERYRQLDDTQAGAQMATCNGNGIDGFIAKLRRNLRQLVFRQSTKIVRALNAIE